jgi:predicted transcriptional regulator
MSEKLLSEINSKLNVVINLMAKNLVKDLNQTEAIIELGNFGLDRNTISTITGASPSTVSVRLSEARKKGLIE